MATPEPLTPINNHQQLYISDFVKIVIENYGVALRNAETLRSLQEWENQQRENMGS